MLDYLKKLVGDTQAKKLSTYYNKVKQINKLEAEIEKLTDEQLKAKTIYFKEQLENGKNILDIQVEAFAVVREAAKRVNGMRHFDVQFIGGMVLAEGNIAEMPTGEGKTLVASLPSYLRALEGKGVHVITVNDYLARRDRELIGGIHEFLGLTVGLNLPMMELRSKRNQPMQRILHMELEMNLVLTICAIIWPTIQINGYKDLTIMRLSMK